MIADRLDRWAAWWWREARARPVVLGVPFVALVACSIARRLVDGASLRVGVDVVFAVLVVGSALLLWRAMTFARRYEKAFEAGDADEVLRLRRIIEGDGPPRTAGEASMRALGDGELWLRLGRWAEGRDALLELDTSTLPEVTHPGIASQIGYGMAHAGQAKEGVEMIARALRDAGEQPRYPARKKWFLLARLGIALSLAGRHEEAIEALGRVLKIQGIDDGDLRAASHFWLARSLRATGDLDGAMLELGRATAEKGLFARRAKRAIAEAASMPHRDGGGTVRVEIGDDEPEGEERGERSAPRRRS